MKNPVKCCVCGVIFESDEDVCGIDPSNVDTIVKYLCRECRVIAVFASAIYLQFFKMFPDKKSATSYELVQLASREDFSIDCVPEEKKTVLNKCLAMPKMKKIVLDAERIDKCLEAAGLNYEIKW
jgi:hypothetical protein